MIEPKVWRGLSTRAGLSYLFGGPVDIAALRLTDYDALLIERDALRAELTEIKENRNNLRAVIAELESDNQKLRVRLAEVERKLEHQIAITTAEY